MESLGDSRCAAAIRRVADSLCRLGTSLLDLCFPRSCAGCRTTWLAPDQGFWCEGCLEVLPWLRPPICPSCGRPFLKSASSSDHLCGDCILSPLPFDSARSATQHSGVVRDRIHQLKFGGQLQWVPPLAELLAMTFQGEPPEHVQCIVPVPLHTKRLRQRGFNQSGLMAVALGRRLRIPVQFGALVRENWTEPQTRLNRDERLKNVKGAFAVASVPLVRDRGILLVDDVLTTGTTVSECARTLRKAGATHVHVLTVTRALPDWKS
jgi:ComF family protein